MKRVTIAIFVAALLASGASAWSKWDDWFVKPDLRAGLESSLKDPFSVQYRNDKVMPGGGILCGEYSAKNAYGAYAGFHRFIARGHQYVVEGETLATWGLDQETVKRDLDAQISVTQAATRSALAAAKAGLEVVKPSEAELASRANLLQFKALWDEYCQATASGN